MMTLWKRVAGAVAVAAVAAMGGAAACDSLDELLVAENPERLLEEELDDVKLVPVLVNSVVGEFQDMYADPFIWRGSMITDEQVTGINWEQTARLNLRVLKFDEGDANGMYTALHRARWMADTVTSKLRLLLEEPNKDPRLALTLAYAGYTYVLMAETLCESTINLSAKVFTTDELAQIAITRFQEAITIATAAGDSRIVNLARTGMARAHLWLGNREKVKEFASQVPANFVWWVEYKDQAGSNILQSRVSGSNHALGVHPRFLNGTFGTQNLVSTQTDPRIQHTTRWTLGHNRLTKLYKPYQSLPFSGFNGEAQATGGRPILYERDTDIKLASGLEARHHFAEADGPTAATLAFVNERRAFGNQPPVNLSGDALMAELREQRARDMYLGGFRLGDLRRWKRQGVGDFFPKGTHPNDEWGEYADAECWPIPLQEYEGNPNLTKPRG